MAKDAVKQQEFKSSESARRAKMRLPQVLLWLGGVAPLVAGIAGFSMLGGIRMSEGMGAAQWAAVVLLYVGVVCIIPFALYCWRWSNRASRHRVLVCGDALTYCVQSGARRNVERSSYGIESVEALVVRPRALWVRARCTVKSSGRVGSWNEGARLRWLWIPRTFSSEDENAVLELLRAREKAAE